MFEREHHVRIATILQVLDAEMLLKRSCYFGGGTAIVLSHDEYRESLDVDFMISDKEGYKDLRQSVTGGSGLSALVRPGARLNLARDVRADQYGLRTMIQAGSVNIKFEIVFENRIQFDRPGPSDRVCGVATLTKVDMAASKLLANSDRWSDDSVYSRDLIDLAMLNLNSEDFHQALEKASDAYGASIERDLKKAIKNLKSRKGRLSECLEALKMEQVPEALVWQRIRDLL